VQTCSRCNVQTHDSMITCPNCHANLSDYSVASVTLKKFQTNPRVIGVRVSVPFGACSVCQGVRGTYPKDLAPILPVQGCSEDHGCCCFYEPILDQIYP
jgi:hypothetical protein